MKNEVQFTSGQFAKLHHINKRTLHYYDSIGLFSPSLIGENGYRYYTYQQSTTLEMILTMRELHMSIEEIQIYLRQRSPEAFQKIVDEKVKDIKQSIQNLKAIQRLLCNKKEQLSICENLDVNRIEVIEIEDEYLLLSESISGVYDEHDFAVFVEHANENRNHRIFNMNYGSMISVENIKSNQYDNYACFFTKMPKEKKLNLYHKEKGNYIRAYCKGEWEAIPNTYKRILTFAKEHHLRVSGYGYEEGLNEMAISNMDEYITQISVRCEEI
ncbi:MAG: MerR family transcriptional regulator [Longicatena sp.]